MQKPRKTQRKFYCEKIDFVNKKFTINLVKKFTNYYSF